MNLTVVIVSTRGIECKLGRTVRGQDSRVEAWKARAIEDGTSARWSSTRACGRCVRHAAPIEPHDSCPERYSNVRGAERTEARS